MPENTLGQINDKKISFFDKDLIILFIVSKVLVVLSLVGFYYYLDEFHYLNLWNRYYTGAESPDFFFMPFANWDGQNYLLLADWGYNAWEPAQAFFPLFPILIRTVNSLVRNTYLATFILNLVLSYAFFFMFYKYGFHHIPRSKTLQALVFFLCYPTAFYMTVFYSEALFLFLLFSFLYYYEIKKSRLSLIFALLLPLTRGQAAFMPVAFMVNAAIKYFRKKELDIKFEVLNLFAFFLSGIIYLLFYNIVTGSPTTGIEAQSHYLANNSLINVFKPGNFLQSLFAYSNMWFTYNNSITDKLFIIGILLSTFVVAKSKNHLWVFIYVALFYPPASMGQGASFSRYSLAVIPFLSLAVLKIYAHHKKLILVTSVLFLIIQLIFIFRFSLNNWVG